MQIDTTSTELPMHPAANILPMMTEEELADLAKDIKAKATEVHHHSGYPSWGTFDLPSYLMPVCHACHRELEGKDQ